MTLFFLLIVLVVLLLAAIWWNPKKQTVSQSASQPSLFASLIPSSTATTDRDAVFEYEIREIVDVIRQDEADRRRAAALERLASIQASSKKTK